MNYRKLGKTGYEVSEISFGAWAIGAEWGDVKDEESLAALHTAVDAGVNFFDTADVYGDGRSERLLAQLKKDRAGENIIIATKAGRRLPLQTVDGYSRENLTEFIDRSLKNLDTDTLDLVQLHCPPQDAYYHPEIFGIMDDFVQEGKIRFYGVSVERVEEAVKAIEYPGVQTVQIIFNIFRQRPADLFFDLAEQKNIGILARLPLSSGMLSGKMSKESTFSKDDHRNYNRHGEAFDVGETFSGIDFETGLAAVEELRPLVPAGMTMAQLALRWILMFDAVNCAIPGAKNPAQAEGNAKASDFPPLSEELMKKIRDIYEARIKPLVHQSW
ncbi:MAG: aldo/keto reductase [Acidobacteria bacterium]|nr:aldo/keto reductase [Acidobacteriota bacterium]